MSEQIVNQTSQVVNQVANQIANPAVAQAGQAAAQADQLGMLNFIMENLSHVAPILICGVAAIAIIFERIRSLYQLYPISDSDGFIDRARILILGGKMNEAIALCDSAPQKPIAQVIRAGLMRAHQPEHLIENGLAIAITRASQQVQKRTSFLATIANVATLLGLFGTIAGLIQSFQAVGHADAQQKSQILAAGISTAMNATMMGLGVAIPCMVAFSFLMNRTNRLISQIDEAGIRTLDMLKQRHFAEENFDLGNDEIDSHEASHGRNEKVRALKKSA